MTRLSLHILPCNTVAFWHRLGDSWFYRSGIAMPAIWILPWNRHTIFRLVEESSCKKLLLLLCFILVFSVFIIIIFYFYLLTNILLFLWVRWLFFVIDVTQVWVSVCVHLYIQGKHCCGFSFLLFSFVSLARASDYRSQLVMLFSVFLDSSTSRPKWQMFIQIEDISIFHYISH